MHMNRSTQSGATGDRRAADLAAEWMRAYAAEDTACTRDVHAATMGEAGDPDG